MNCCSLFYHWIGDKVGGIFGFLLGKGVCMGAPDGAVPIGNGFVDEGGVPVDLSVYGVGCVGCGWVGSFDELVGVDDEDTLWCPRCGCSGWVYL